MTYKWKPTNVSKFQHDNECNSLWCLFVTSDLKTWNPWQQGWGLEYNALEKLHPIKIIGWPSYTEKYTMRNILLLTDVEYGKTKGMKK